MFLSISAEPIVMKLKVIALTFSKINSELLVHIANFTIHNYLI